MTSDNMHGSNMLFQSITEDLDASLATADELSREFSSLFQEISSTTESSTQSTNSRPENTSSSSTSSGFGNTSSSSMSGGFGNTSSGNGSSSTYAGIGGETSSKANISSGCGSSVSRDGSGGTLTRATLSISQSPDPIWYSEPSTRPTDSFYSGRNRPTSPMPQIQQLASSQTRFTPPEQGYPRGTLTPPNMSPHSQRRASPIVRSQERSLSGSLPPGYIYDHQPLPSTLQVPTKPMPLYDSSTTGRKSPRMDRVPSPGPYSQPVVSTLPRNFTPFKSSDDAISKQRNLTRWNESDLDVTYERKPHHTYEKKEWIRQPIPNNNWRESNLDSPSLLKKDPLPRHVPSSEGTLTRTNRISMHPDRASPTQSSCPQPIISRISIPPVSSGPRPRRPIPLSVIMRLQNPYYTAATRYPCGIEGEMGVSIPHQPVPIARELLYHFQPVVPEQRQTVSYGEGSSSSDVDAEVAKLNTLNKPLSSLDNLASIEEQSKEPKAEIKADDQDADQPPRPLSPSRLQPVVAPEATLIPNIDELLRIRAEFPRALKKRGSTDQSQSLKRMPINQPSQYRQMIKKLFRRKGPQTKVEMGTESSSSDGEESSSPSTPNPPTNTTTAMTPQQKGLHSILRKPKGSGVKAQSPRARLSPLVLLLDGALVGELDTVQRAVQEMSDPSQPNDEGITALHNAICGGHYSVVVFLVRIGANISAPDSHGWTPLHCAASCNDRDLCEFLVHNGAAVMAVTESDGATAAQKCDPYAVGYEECESFLRGVEEAMGVDNSGVLYALWSYPAQAPDELSFKEGDMVTILQKPEGVDWWWASLCGREGFVPNNYFGLFPKVRPKSLC